MPVVSKMQVTKILSEFSFNMEGKELTQDTEPSQKVRLLVVGIKLNTQWDCNLDRNDGLHQQDEPWFGLYKAM
jgi:hypothetical protein